MCSRCSETPTTFPIPQLFRFVNFISEWYWRRIDVQCANIPNFSLPWPPKRRKTLRLEPKLQSNQLISLISLYRVLQVFATCSTFYVPLLVILVLYWKIYQTARKRIHRRRPKQIISANNNQVIAFTIFFYFLFSSSSSYFAISFHSQSHTCCIFILLPPTIRNMFRSRKIILIGNGNLVFTQSAYIG